MESILLVVHVVLSIGIIGLVLLQRGKGADAGAALGGGSSGSVFGSQGSANFLSRSTAILATLFFVVSLSLAYIAAHRSQPTSVLDSVTSIPAEQAPAKSNADVPAAESATPAAENSSVPAAD